MERDYWPLIRAASELDQFTGYLDTEGQKQLGLAKGNYLTMRDRMSHELLVDHGDWQAAVAQITSDLNDLSVTEAGWADTISGVKDDLAARLESDSSKSLLRRRLKYFAFPITIALLVTAYVGTWWYNNLTIDKPIETRDGLTQRAQAFDKAQFYDELAGGRGGFIKRAIISAVQPDDEEIKAAQDFMGLTLEGYLKLEGEGFACGLSTPEEGENLSAEHLALVDTVSQYVQAPDTKWEPSPPMTLLTKIADTYPCAQSPEEHGEEIKVQAK